MKLKQGDFKSLGYVMHIFHLEGMRNLEDIRDAVAGGLVDRALGGEGMTQEDRKRAEECIIDTVNKLESVKSYIDYSIDLIPNESEWTDDDKEMEIDLDKFDAAGVKDALSFYFSEFSDNHEASQDDYYSIARILQKLSDEGI